MTERKGNGYTLVRKPILRERHFEKKEIKLGASKNSAPLLKKKSGKSRMSEDLPPLIENSKFVRKTVFRYICTNLALSSISVKDIIGALGCVAINSTTVNPWASSFKIHKIVAWPSASSSVDLFWNSGVGALTAVDSEKSKDLPTGITVTGRCVFVPPKKTLASDWIPINSTTSAANIFSFQQTADGAILDLHISFTLANTFTAGSITVSTATTGLPYYLALDGNGSGANHIVPLHLPTTS